MLLCAQYSFATFEGIESTSSAFRSALLVNVTSSSLLQEERSMVVSPVIARYRRSSEGNCFPSNSVRSGHEEMLRSLIPSSDPFEKSKRP